MRKLLCYPLSENYSLDETNNFEENGFYEGRYNFKAGDCLHSRIQTTAIFKKKAFGLCSDSAKQMNYKETCCSLSPVQFICKIYVICIYCIPEWLTDQHRIWERKINCTVHTAVFYAIESLTKYINIKITKREGDTEMWVSAI